MLEVVVLGADGAEHQLDPVYPARTCQEWAVATVTAPPNLTRASVGANSLELEETAFNARIYWKETNITQLAVQRYY